MKLRNKKTGEIKEVEPITIGGFRSLAALNEEWEDYEEPKEYWYIYADKPQRADCGDILEEDFKAIGNYFETREEAEKAVEKLKTWHKLMDYWGTEVLGWEIRDMPTGGNWQTVNVKLNVKTRKEPMELLDILFGGEE